MPNTYKLFLVDVHSQGDVWVLERMFKNRGIDVVEMTPLVSSGVASCKAIFPDGCSARDTMNEIMERTRSCGGMCSGYRPA
jgi:hypothetical protein